MRQPALFCPNLQRGSALLIFSLVLISVLLGTFLSRLNSANQETQRNQITSDVLVQAKEALIGFAVTYRDTHPTELIGYLPCPDTNNDGVSDGPCGLQDVSVLGHLPWKTLGIPPLRDDSGECLWYSVSGRAKNDPKTAVLNWDTLGQFIIQDIAGTILAGATDHDRPFAVILAPRSSLNAQLRTPLGTTECGGNNTPADYFENIGALGTGNTTLVISNTDSVRNGTNNDRALWISGKDIFDRVKIRNDFKNDIDILLNDLSVCLNAISPVVLPAASPSSNKGIDNVYSTCRPALNASKKAFLDNWKDNLLYAGGPSGSFTAINNGATCKAVLIFSGERTTRTIAPLIAQSRAIPAQQGNVANYGDPTMYLEGTNATLFPANGTYTGNAYYATGTPSADVTRCITGAGAAQVSFTTDLPSFVTPGTTPPVTINTSDTTDRSVTITANATGSAAGCLWSPTVIPLANKTLRVYYEYQFGYSDTFSTTGAIADRGNGMTFQFVNGDLGYAPNTCGTVTNLGALNLLDSWGRLSYIVETDVRDNATNDPAGNHTAIMINGGLAHAAAETQTATSTTPCNGSKSSCQFYPANTFEEYPAPLLHKQRIEMHTGCNSTCSRCNPKSSDSYAKISVWVDCTDCSDVSADFTSSEIITNIVNRDFSATGDWTGATWSWAASEFTHTVGATAATLPNTALSSAPAIGTSYQVNLVVNTSGPGNITISLGGNSTDLLPQASGTSTYSIRFDPTSTAPLTLTPDASWTGSISSASIKSVTSPQTNRCVSLYNPEMRQGYFGITAGFLPTADNIQNVTIKNLYLRSD